MISFVLLPQASQPSVNFNKSELVYCKCLYTQCIVSPTKQFYSSVYLLSTLSATLYNLINEYYYSFKIFPRFWLAKSAGIIHHNQLLMTKFGWILCLTRKWRQKCSLLQVNAPLTEKTWGRGWVVLVVNLKNGGHFTRFKSKN